MSLTPRQLGRITQHLRFDNWLNNRELIDELQDHYAEAIATRLQSGTSFEEALAQTTADFGERRGLLAMEEAKNGTIFQQSIVSFKRVIKLYRNPHRLFILGWVFLTMYGLTQYGSLLWLRDHVNTPIVAVLGGLSVLLFIRHGLLYVAGKETVQPFPVIACRFVSITLVLYLLRFVTFGLSWLPVSFFTPVVQVSLATLYVFLWAAVIEAVFVKKQLAVR